MAPKTYDLIGHSKEELVNLITLLLDKLTEKERLEFVSKWINPQVALEEAGAYDSSNFVQKVETFCVECLDKKYFVARDYDEYEYSDYYYDDDEVDNYSESEWAEQFSIFLKLSVMYSRNNDYAITYKTFDKLLNCIHEAEFDEEILGTDNPMDYIEADWDEVFNEYYISMRTQISDKNKLASKAVAEWIRFGERCTEGIFNNLDDIMCLEEAIRISIGDNMDCWCIQHQLFELLKRFYLKVDLTFDEVAIAKSLVCYNPNFSNDVAQGYVSREMWGEAVQIIKDALNEVSDQSVVSSLNKKLVDCYENLSMFREAYEVAVNMFVNHNRHELYIRARGFAIKLDDLNTFIDKMVKYIQASKRYEAISDVLRILSFEGSTEKLISTALKSDTYSRHDYLKYTTKSLIYRALGSKNIVLSDLKEFIQSIENEKIAGIVDMIKISKDSENEQSLLNSAIGILKQMVQFHINVAQRSRYARAAYYCAVIKDIYTYMNEADEFKQYYGAILFENKRRPALKDEMKKKIG